MRRLWLVPLVSLGLLITGSVVVGVALQDEEPDREQRMRESLRDAGLDPDRCGITFVEDSDYAGFVCL